MEKMFVESGNQWKCKCLGFCRDKIMDWSQQMQFKFIEVNNNIVLLCKNIMIHIYGYTMENCIYFDAYHIETRAFGQLSIVSNEEVEKYISQSLMDDIKSFRGSYRPFVCEEYEEVYEKYFSNPSHDIIKEKNIHTNSTGKGEAPKKERRGAIDSFLWKIDDEQIGFDMLNDNPFDPDKNRIKYRYAKKFSVLWSHNEVEHEISDLDNFAGDEYNCLLGAVPSITLQKIVVLYRFNPKYRNGCNALIYNADGTICTQLNKPKELLSDMGRKNNPFLRDDKTLEYYECGWKRDKGGNLVVCVRIVFNQEWWEERELDVDTGELKGLLDEGRL